MKKIVVIDDDHDILFTARKAIEINDDEYQTITYDSGKKLLESLKEDKPVILLVIMMPDMDGMFLID